MLSNLNGYFRMRVTRLLRSFRNISISRTSSTQIGTQSLSDLLSVRLKFIPKNFVIFFENFRSPYAIDNHLFICMKKLKQYHQHRLNSVEN